VLKSVNGVDINTLATLHINDDLSASGSAGCNNYSGQGEMDENKFRIRQMAMTRKLCEPQVMKGEQAVSQVLSGWSEIALSGNHLSLQNSVHKLIFRPE
jgi:heat shock protein HslJ